MSYLLNGIVNLLFPFTGLSNTDINETFGVAFIFFRKWARTIQIGLPFSMKTLNQYTSMKVCCRLENFARNQPQAEIR